MAIELGKTEAEAIIFAVDEAWLDKRREEVLDPDLPIIDPHHHLWDRGSRYLLDELLKDIGSGHNIRATVYSQCDSMYRADGDPLMAPLGETEFVNGIAAMSASNTYGTARVCAGMVGFADLTLGDRIDPLVEAHLRASGRFRGVRHCSVWDADKSIKSTPMDFPKGLLLDAKFREGFGRLGKFGISFDSWIYHPQIPELADLASAFPGTPVILDHVGAPLGIGAYAAKRDAVYAIWRENIRDLARRPNAYVKLGGMGMHLFGFDFEHREIPPSSEELANVWRPYVETCIEAFGVDRCMFESNFPVDKRSCSYAVLWNAFKRLAHGGSPKEKAALFFDTAKRVYRLELD
jgi:predicted TIM-barrel fold metal-dependent hydrolase